jgi:superfamily II DNA or RNA helicase
MELLAQLAGSMRIPVSAVDLARLTKQLTYRFTPMGEREAIEVQGYRRDGDSILVPRQFGLSLCNRLQIPFEDTTAQGEAIVFPKKPTPREYQKAPLAQIITAFGEYYDVVFRAHTGWGKTIGALLVAAHFGRSIVIIVDQDNLKDQWVEVLLNPNLFGLTSDQIGIVQGDRCDYQGKLVTICMVQTLTQREFPEEFYDSFGFLIGDETHTLGAPTFGQILLQFHAAYRLFVSATPRRKDGLQKALEYNCGPIRVAADKKHDTNAVYIRRSYTTYSWYGNISPKVGRIITEVSEDGLRNLMVAESAQWLVEGGRATLVLSDRIEQLKNIKCLLIYMGVPEEEIGMYTGYDLFWQFTKDPAPKKRPADLHRYTNEEGEEVFAPYTAVGMVQKQKVVPKKRLEEIKSKCSYILATYGKFQKGVDEPRLAGGVDASPRSTSEQTHGRILRELNGKLESIWITIVDENSYRLLHSFSGRIGDYLNSNACFYEWDGQEEIEPWNAQELHADVRARVNRLRPQEILQDKQTKLWYISGKSAQANAQDEIKRRLSKPDSRRLPTSRSAAPERKSEVPTSTASPLRRRSTSRRPQ